MLRWFIPIAATFYALWLPAPPVSAEDKEKTAREFGKIGNHAFAEKLAHETLARFDKGDPGWRVRMESLVGLVKAGPATVPVLVEALKSGAPSTREFAAQALVVLVDERARAALVQALDGPERNLHIYAIKALNMLSPLELTKPQRERLGKGVPHWMREYISHVAERTEASHPKAMLRALRSFDLSRVDTAHLGHVAPEFALADAGGKVTRLSQFRGKKMVILEFNSGDG